MKLYDYQILMKNMLIELYKTGDYAYLQMPTGTGKTVTAISTLRQLKAKKVLWVVGTRQLVEQTKLVAPNWVTVETWQMAFNRKLWKRVNFDYLVIDEVHFGGSGVDNRTFTAIIEAFKDKKKMYLSATAWELDEKLLGQSEANSAVYYLRDAFQNKLLPTPTFHQIRIGKELTIANIECKTKLSSVYLETLEDAELRGVLSHHKVDKSDLNAVFGLTKNRIDALAIKAKR